MIKISMTFKNKMYGNRLASSYLRNEQPIFYDGRKKMFYLTTHSTHFVFTVM